MIRTVGFRARWSVFVGLALALPAASSCRSASDGSPPATTPAFWDVTGAEILEWRPDEPEFGQGFALETSGLATAGRLLLASSEKYARLLVMDPADGLRTRVIAVGVPRHSEIEGIAWHDGVAWLCDEAHAAVYRAEVGDERELLAASPGTTVDATAVPLTGVEVVGGKVGVEGIEVSADGRTVYLLLERSLVGTERCVSRIWRLRVEPQRLVAEGDPVDVALEDCAWRLTGLAWMGETLLALKTQFPGERYQVVEVDPSTGTTSVLVDLTALLRGVRADGWGNNVEGIAVDDDGALWLIGDNAVTDVVDDPTPPPTDERAVLLRIPLAE
jgi:uncharacterized protein YjiK